MDVNAIALARAQRAYAKQDYERQVVQDAGIGSASFENAGPPHWNRQAWNVFHNQYGFYPYSASELPPSFAGAPDWAYELMGLRRPPVSVSP